MRSGKRTEDSWKEKMKERLVFLLKFYVLTVLLFIVAKVVFMLVCHEGHVFTAADVWQPSSP